VLRHLWILDAWLSGVQSGSFNATDDVRIKNAIIDVDGSSSNGLGTNVGHSCDYTQRIPCPNGVAGVNFNTASLPDGAHTIRFLALDTADNSGDAGTPTPSTSTPRLLARPGCA
jgi:hypothetical protein